MPARIVIVHDDRQFLDRAAIAFRLAGHEVACFSGSMDALRALEGAEAVELLITRVRFAPGTPHGLSLARMARCRRPHLKVLFAARPDMAEHTEGVGELVQYPIDMGELVERAAQLLAG